MEKALSDKLDMMALVWDELAVGSSTIRFSERFLPDLKDLDDFQRDFPDESPLALVRHLEAKVLRVLRQQYTKSEFLQLRARFNQSN